MVEIKENKPELNTTNTLNEKISSVLDNINTKIARVTNRSILFYRELLWIDIETLNWKSILNLWSWNSKIDEEIESAWISTNMFVNIDRNKKDNNIIWDMRSLPFKDESFNNVIWLWSISWIPEKDKIQAINEALRVCKTFWEISIYPVTINSSEAEYLKSIKWIKIIEPNIKHSWLINYDDKIFKLLSQVELYLVDIVHKSINSLRWKKTINLQITKMSNIDEIKNTIISSQKNWTRF